MMAKKVFSRSTFKRWALSGQNPNLW
jgi:hypothetical protein